VVYAPPPAVKPRTTSSLSSKPAMLSKPCAGELLSIGRV
jgi:hypothetical protein